jgi:hypothetical protein
VPDGPGSSALSVLGRTGGAIRPLAARAKLRRTRPAPVPVPREPPRVPGPLSGCRSGAPGLDTSGEASPRPRGAAVKYLILVYSNPAFRELWEGLSDAQRMELGQGHAALNEALAASGELIVAEGLADPSLPARLSPGGSDDYHQRAVRRRQGAAGRLLPDRMRKPGTCARRGPGWVIRRGQLGEPHLGQTRPRRIAPSRTRTEHRQLHPLRDPPSHTTEPSHSCLRALRRITGHVARHYPPGLMKLDCPYLTRSPSYARLAGPGCNGLNSVNGVTRPPELRDGASSEPPAPPSPPLPSCGRAVCSVRQAGASVGKGMEGVAGLWSGPGSGCADALDQRCTGRPP